MLPFPLLLYTFLWFIDFDPWPQDDSHRESRIRDEFLTRQLVD